VTPGIKEINPTTYTTTLVKSMALFTQEFSSYSLEKVEISQESRSQQTSDEPVLGLPFDGSTLVCSSETEVKNLMRWYLRSRCKFHGSPSLAGLLDLSTVEARLRHDRPHPLRFHQAHLLEGTPTPYHVLQLKTGSQYLVTPLPKKMSMVFEDDEKSVRFQLDEKTVGLSANPNDSSMNVNQRRVHTNRNL
jgi:hypothetical protein